VSSYKQLASRRFSADNRGVPNIKNIGPYRFFFASSDRGEPPHVHVEYDNRVAKFWLDPVELAKSGRLSEHQLRQIGRHVTANRVEFIEAWHEYFNS
jgi:hypothetical protein